MVQAKKPKYFIYFIFAKKKKKGNQEEFTINEFADFIKQSLDFDVTVKHLPAVQDDPQQRKPDISRAKKVLNWSPQFSVLEGIHETAHYYKLRLDSGYT